MKYEIIFVVCMCNHMSLQPIWCSELSVSISPRILLGDDDNGQLQLFHYFPSNSTLVNSINEISIEKKHLWLLATSSRYWNSYLTIHHKNSKFSRIQQSLKLNTLQRKTWKQIQCPCIRAILGGTFIECLRRLTNRKRFELIAFRGIDFSM